MKQYHTVKVSWDEALLKRRTGPQSIKITTKSFDEYMEQYTYGNWNNYYRDIDFLYDRIPENLEGTFDYKDVTWDYMDAYFYRFSMIAAVSEKVKNILEDLNVSKDEYVLKPIKVKGYEGPYYLFFVKVLPESEIIYSKTLFRNNETKELCKFDSDDDVRQKIKDGILCASEIHLDSKHASRDIISIQYHPADFFSQRLVDAFREHNVKGVEIGSRDHEFKICFDE